MLTLRQAAELLAQGDSLDDLVPLAAALGFEPGAIPLDVAARRALGLPAEITAARLARGAGALRALLVAGARGPALRSLLTATAVALAKQTSHVLWMVVALSGDGEEVGLACWPEHPRAPRIRALVVRRRHVVASDAESVCALAACSGGEDLLVHLRWADVLGRDTLSRRFYRTLEQCVRGLAASLSGVPAADRAELALLCASRLIFLCFLQSKGWMDGDRAFLSRHFDRCMASGGRFHQRVLLPLFFGTLNTPPRRRAPLARHMGAIPFLNGGLFTRTPLERRHAKARFSDAALGELFSSLLDAYRFTAREDQERWTEAAVDPEMLGRAFESLMAAGERRTTGAFYTPQALVTHLGDRALVAALAGAGLSADLIERALHGAPLGESLASALRPRLRTLTVLDPSCGSGAFLVYVLERLADLHRAAGDARDVSVIRRDVLARSIHGVDVNPTAVWLCELRLWLSVVIESEEQDVSRIPPLPNLDCNIRVGDALSGDAFRETPGLLGPPAVLQRLRARYARAAGARKAPLRRILAREERRRALAALDRELHAVAGARRERLLAQRGSDLFGERTLTSAQWRTESAALRLRAAALRRERRRIEDGGALPFSFASHFGHVHEAGGFGLVIGNPPWVRLHNIPRASRAALRASYRVFREPAWDAGTRPGEARGFAAQADLSALFIERSVSLAAPHGTLALLVPAKLWRSLSGGGVRRLLATDTRLLACEDWSEAPCSFDAAVYPSVLIATRPPGVPATARFTVRRRSLEVRWDEPAQAVRLRPDDPACPWLLHPRDVRQAFDRVLAHGIALGASPLGRATLGVKCGCNDAFMVATTHPLDALERAPLATVQHRGRHGHVERSLLRPLLRGESLAPWRARASTSAIVWTHAEHGPPLTALPPGAARWLAPWRRRLATRTDLHEGRWWWMLFRTEGATSSRTRVVWSDFGRTPRAALLPAGDPTVPLNSCYVVACDDPVDALTLAALLNSPLAAAWLNAIAEPARGGWHRYLAWTVSLLPLPRDWHHARRVLAPLAESALMGLVPADEELFAAACRAYRLRSDDVAPLVAWCT